MLSLCTHAHTHKIKQFRIEDFLMLHRISIMQTDIVCVLYVDSRLRPTQPTARRF